ncbi:proline iminopeptidase-family hydrolase [Chryseolinea sp. T2]|uniref:proline iminopeptidase-family hydrolase n=1 Tax=Chryseolinea sp. T2 TaxID=3129255 RepID=UPI003076EB8F
MKNRRTFPASIVLAFVIFTFGCQSRPALAPGEGYVDVKGGKIWYRVIGKGKRTPLMLTHGGPGGTSRSFYQLASIGEDRPIILFDQLGSGRSGYHEDTTLLTVDNFVEQVAALKTELGLQTFYLHGHSWGTALALEYYEKYPQGIKGLIFNSPYFNTRLWKADADTLIMGLPDSTQRAIYEGEKTGDFEAAAYLAANEIYAKNFGLRKTRLTSELDTVPAPGNKFIYKYMWGPTEFTATGTLKSYDNLDELKNIDVPTLFITGEFDEARPKTVRYFQTLVAGSKLVVIEGAGHGTMHDNREQNIAAIKTFLDSLDAKGL